MLFRLKNYEFLRFFLCDQPYRFRNISQTSELKSTSENVSASTWFIYFDGLCNYLNLFQKQLAANFFNSCCFPIQGHVGHCTNKFTETELGFFIKYLFTLACVRINWYMKNFRKSSKVILRVRSSHPNILQNS